MNQPPRIALPIPTSNNPEYNARAWFQYADAIRNAGGEPVEVSLDLAPHQVAQLISTCAGVLLPGSPNDLNPQKYGEEPNGSSPADPKREDVDELLIQDAHNLHKPMLCICAGLQAVNVWRNGTLIQDLPLPDEQHANHKAGREVVEAHAVSIDPKSVLAEVLLGGQSTESKVDTSNVFVNSSHHQALQKVGDGLFVTAFSPLDGVVEAVENSNLSGHFLLGVQWHPERLNDDFSRGIFARFVAEAARWKPRTIKESIG